MLEQIATTLPTLIEPGANALVLSVLETAFPRGMTHYFLGGVLIGIAVIAIYLPTAIIVGQSTFLETTLSYVSDIPRFHRTKYLTSRRWRIVFVIGVVAGGFLYVTTLGTGFLSTDVQLWRLFLGGILVGFGTRLGKGCTSGNGICGIGSLSQTSIVNTAIFFIIAIITAQVVLSMGVLP